MKNSLLLITAAMLLSCEPSEEMRPFVAASIDIVGTWNLEEMRMTAITQEDTLLNTPMPIIDEKWTIGYNNGMVECNGRVNTFDYSISNGTIWIDFDTMPYRNVAGKEKMTLMMHEDSLFARSMVYDGVSYLFIKE